MSSAHKGKPTRFIRVRGRIVPIYGERGAGKGARGRRGGSGAKAMKRKHLGDAASVHGNLQQEYREKGDKAAAPGSWVAAAGVLGIVALKGRARFASGLIGLTGAAVGHGARLRALKKHRGAYEKKYGRVLGEKARAMEFGPKRRISKRSTGV